MNSYGSHNSVAHEQQQHQQHYSAQYNQYPHHRQQIPGQQQQSQYDGSQYQSPNQYHHGQNWQQHQAPWTGQQHQMHFRSNATTGYNSAGDQGYQNPYPQNANSHSHNNNPRHHHNPPPISQSCYNCGGADHWAQNCPEPRRTNPAGAMNDNRQPKRQKTNGPIVTRYPPPPNYQQRGPHRGYTHPPGGQSQGHQYNKYPGVQTPASANSFTQNQWQQQSPAQSSPQSQPSLPGTPWAQQGAQTPLSQSASPNSTPGTSHQNSFSSKTGSQYPNGPDFKRNSYDASGQVSRYSSQSSEHGPGTASHRKGDPDGPFFAVDHLEPWMEELQSLDIPDKQSNSSTTVWHPPNPVAQPLPPTASEADAIGRLPIAATLPPGTPVSKYFRNKSVEEIARPIQDTPEFPELVLDPAFSNINFEGPVVPISELISRRNALAKILDDETEEVDNHSNYAHDKHPFPTNAHTDFPVEGAKASRSESYAPQSVNELQHQNMKDEETRAREQEEKLAALGVTGTSKPVRGPPPRPILSSQRSSSDVGHQASSRSADVTKTDHHDSVPSQGEESKPPTETHLAPQPPHERKQSKEKQTYTEAQAALQGFPTEDSDDSQSTAPSPGDYSAYSITAPFLDGQIEHSTIIDQDTNGEKPNGQSQQQDTILTPDSKEKSSSPLNSRLTPVESRKRSFREASEESDGGQKRQLDDTIRRLKRRQPQVAEAYGRRW